MNKFTRKKLKSFVVGDSIRFFQFTENNDKNSKIYYNKNYDNDLEYSSGILQEISSLQFKYLMHNEKNENKHILNVLNTSFSEDFRNWILGNNEINTSGTIDDERNKTYYDVDEFDFSNCNINLIQNDKECFLLNTDSYINKKNIDEWNSYKIYQNSISSGKIYDLITSNIDSYNENFLSDSMNVNNKSIPIYEFNKNALNDLYIIKLFNQEEIKNVFIEAEIVNLSSSCLFNSKTYKVDTNDFDSILVVEIIRKIDQIMSYATQEKRNEKIEKVFNAIFKRLPKNSFYRFLNPVGQIKIYGGDDTILKDINQYMYSIDIKNTYDAIKTNYFSLKNFSNPELNYNYNIVDMDKYLNCEITSNIDGYKELNTNYYNLIGKLQNNILEYYLNEVYYELNNYINDNNLLIISGSYIQNNNLLSSIITEFKDYYKYVDDETIDIIFYGDNKTKNIIYKNFYVFAFKLYMLKKENMNLDENYYIITNEDLKNKIDSLFENFYNVYDNVIKNSALSFYINKNFENSFSKLKENANKYIVGIENKNILDNKIAKEVLSLLNIKNILDGKVDSSLKDILSLNKSFSFSNDLINISNLSSNFELKTKLDEYNYHIDDLYKHNNAFKLSGYLYGKREYKNCGINYNNDIWLSYNYDVKFDKEYENTIISNYLSSMSIETINDLSGRWQKIIDDIKEKNKNVQNIIDSIEDKEYQNALSSNIIKYHTLIEFEDNIKNMPIFSRTTLTDLIIVDNENKKFNSNFNKIVFRDKNDKFLIFDKNCESYFKVLDGLSKFEFGEVIEGQHYYKESQYSKSNIFSIDIKNSGFEYKVYTYDEIKDSLTNDMTINESNYYVAFNKNDFEDDTVSRYLPNEAGHRQYLSGTQVEDYLFFKCKKFDEKGNIDVEAIKNEYELVRAKYQIQKYFNDVIRKSIHRYIPVNTTLWKIQYSGR